MPPDVRDLCSRTEIKRANQWWWIVDGLDADETYGLYQATADTLDEDEEFFDACFDVSPPKFTFTANANGVAVVTAIDILATNHFDLYVKQTAQKSGDCKPPASFRLSDEWNFAVVSPAEADTPYVDAGTLTATPGAGEVDLDWDAATSCIGEAGHIVYRLWRRTGASGEPIGQTLLMDWDTDLTYLDTAVTDGVTYRYRVEAAFLLDDYATPVGMDGVFGASNTNIATATVDGDAALVVNLSGVRAHRTL